MIKNIFIIATIALLTGCGGSSSSTDSKIETKSIPTTSNYHIAKDTLVHDLTKDFNGYQLKVLTDKTIGEDETSNDFISVYGKINGKDTNALLVLNANYPKGTKVIVEVYNGDTLVSKSKPIALTSDSINFGSISTK